MKVGLSLDGHLASATGKSEWVTSEAAREDAMTLRATCDAVAVGSGTALADDPRLTLRGSVGRDPIPVIFDGRGRMGAEARVTRGPRRPWRIVGPDAPRSVAYEDLVVPGGPHGVALAPALELLAARGVERLLVEGGATLLRSLFDGSHVDEVVTYISGRLLPGGLGWVGGPSVDCELDDLPPLHLLDVARVGPDLRARWAVRRPTSAGEG